MWSSRSLPGTCLCIARRRCSSAHGIDLDRSTLVHWVARAAWWLKPLHELLVATVLSATESVLRRHTAAGAGPDPKADADRAALVLRNRRPAVAGACAAGGRLPFAEDRKGRHVAEHLAGFSGVLQVDAYAGYTELARPDRPGGAIILAYCLAHARRRVLRGPQEDRLIGDRGGVAPVRRRLRHRGAHPRRLRRGPCGRPAGRDQTAARGIRSSG